MTIASRRLALTGLACLAGLGLSGCVGETLDRGYVPSALALQQVTVGAPREQVILALGTPSTTADFGGEVLYYITQKASRPVAFLNTRVTDQSVLAVYLNGDKQVARVANYGLQDGQVFDFISKTTPTSGKDFSFISQLLTATGRVAL